MQFIFFDTAICIVLLLFLRDAYKRGHNYFYLLIAGVFYGLFLEWATIEQLSTYHYSERFIISFQGVPISIGMAWGLIIYSVMLFSDSSSLPGIFRPFLDGLVALNIDFGIDVIAIRMDMWHWGIGLEDEFFGVRYGNFWAWFWVVVSFSATYRMLLVYDRARKWSWLPAIGAIMGGLYGVVLTNHYIQSVFESRYELTILVTGLLALAIVAMNRPRFYLHDKLPLIHIVLIGSHFFFFLLGLLTGALFNPPLLLLVWSVSTLLAVAMHHQVLRSFITRLRRVKDT
ncbi:MAG: carotenoid biosynthesis protein [Desulfobulbaceae bacterium]|nr:MAG: carotenoid biosynthesis protein [Desulfobulbaceae bacterium]